MNWLFFRILDVASWWWGEDAVILWFADHFRKWGCAREADDLMLEFFHKYGEFPRRGDEELLP